MSVLSEHVWRDDMDRVREALAPFVEEDENGAPWIGTAAPESLRSTYRALVSMGYAKGWL